MVCSYLTEKSDYIQAIGLSSGKFQHEVAIDVVILSGAEINIKAEEQKRKALMGIGLDKAALGYLYLQWVISCDVPFNQVRDTRFRAFLEYINPAANRMLPNSDSTIKIRAEGLFDEGKERLRYILATAILDIHLTCGTWTSLLRNKTVLPIVMVKLNSWKND